MENLHFQNDRNHQQIGDRNSLFPHFNHQNSSRKLNFPHAKPSKPHRFPSIFLLIPPVSEAQTSSHNLRYFCHFAVDKAAYNTKNKIIGISTENRPEK
jgi:hypothetical protein